MTSRSEQDAKRPLRGYIYGRMGNLCESIQSFYRSKGDPVPAKAAIVELALRDLATKLGVEIHEQTTD